MVRDERRSWAIILQLLRAEPCPGGLSLLRRAALQTALDRRGRRPQPVHRGGQRPARGGGLPRTHESLGVRQVAADAELPRGRGRRAVSCLDGTRGGAQRAQRSGPGSLRECRPGDGSRGPGGRGAGRRVDGVPPAVAEARCRRDGGRHLVRGDGTSRVDPRTAHRRPELRCRDPGARAAALLVRRRRDAAYVG